MATRSRRLIVTPGRFAGTVFPLYSSFHLRRPTSQSASACNAVVLPELFWPMNTTACPNSMSALGKRLKFFICSRVNIRVSLYGFTLQSIQNFRLGVIYPQAWRRWRGRVVLWSVISFLQDIDHLLYH